MKKKLPIKNISSIKKEKALMNWECVRRRADYRQFYAEHCRLRDAEVNDTKTCSDKLLNHGLHCLFQYGCFPSDPREPFKRLTALTKTYILSADKFARITIPSESLDKELRDKLYTFVKTTQRRILPSHFRVEIVRSKLPHEPRSRCDLKQFEAEMRAWDMRKDQKSWLEIGIELKKFGIPQTNCTALKSTARNYYNAAELKIKRAPRARGVS